MSSPQIKMTDFFYTIIRETVNYNDEERMAELFALKLTDMREWCEEMLNLSEIPDGAFKTAYLSEMFGEDSDEPYNLWRYIQDICAPDEDEEEEKEARRLCINPNCTDFTEQNWCSSCLAADPNKSQNASFPFKSATAS